MKVLVVNCGSSSIKFVLTRMPENEILAKGVVEKMGLPDSVIKYETVGREAVVEPVSVANHTEGVEVILEKLTNPDSGCIASFDEIDAVGHRLVHGGEKFAHSTIITPEVISKLRENIPLAPLHNPANIMGVEAVSKVLPKVTQVGVFDTAFHQTMPREAFLYALPQELYENYGIRRYGFHGISHDYVSHKGAELASIDIANSKIITAHIGNGASMAAILNGKSIDTSMGLTPTEGLMMGSRVGDLDCGIPTMLLDNEDWRKTAVERYLSPKDVERITTEERAKGTSEEDIRVRLLSSALVKLFNNKSGMIGVAGIGSSDMRDIEKAKNEGNEDAALGLKMYYYRIRKYIGAYAAALGGCDLLIFTAGVGENNREMRLEVCKDLGFMGIEIDEKLNNRPAQNMVISKEGSRVKVVVIKTDEEYMIAYDTYKLTQS